MRLLLRLRLLVRLLLRLRLLVWLPLRRRRAPHPRGPVGAG